MAGAGPSVPSARRPIRRPGWCLSYDRGVLELARGRDQDALAAFQRAERLAGRVAAHHPLAIKTRAFLLHTRVRLGQTQRAEQALSEIDPPEREAGEIHLPWRRCGSPRTARRRPPPRSRPSSTAPPRSWSPAAGWFRPSCWRRSRATPSATSPQPDARSSARSISPSSTGRAAVPAPSRAGAAQPPRPARHRARRPDLPHSGPSAGKQPASAPTAPEGLHEPLSRQ